MKLIFQNLYKLTQEFRAEKKSISNQERKPEKKHLRKMNYEYKKTIISD